MNKILFMRRILTSRLLVRSHLSKTITPSLKKVESYYSAKKGDIWKMVYEIVIRTLSLQEIE